jgi:DNA-binding transcriptional regulator YiaG
VPLSFRNVDASPDDPVETWPLEGVVTALESGGLSHRRRLADAIKADPWGPVTRSVEEALRVTRPYGVAPLMESVITHARKAAQDADAAEVAREVDELVRSSGLAAAAFADRVGTSASRLSTYRSGRVSPSATLMVRMRRLARSGVASPGVHLDPG